MGFKVVGGKVQKQARKQPAPRQAPADFKFTLPPEIRPDLTDDETRRVLAATFQVVAEELMRTEWADTFQADNIGPQQLCENLVQLHPIAQRRAPYHRRPPLDTAETVATLWQLGQTFS